MVNIKKYVKENSTILHIVSSIYNLVFSGLIFVYPKKLTIKISNSFCKFKHNILRGGELRLNVGYKTRLNNCRIVNYGNNNHIVIGRGCKISNTTFWFENDNNSISIGDNTTIEGCQFAALEGKMIRIGSDCMFSHSIEIRTSDSHGIMSLNGDRINLANDVIIENNVWIGARVVLLKGTHIPKGCVIGHSSICSKKLKESGAIYAGNPCKLRKEGIVWSRKR